MDQPAAPPSPFQALDGRPVPGSWPRPLAHTLGELWTRAGAADRTILSALGAFIAEHTDALTDLRGRPASGADIPAGARKTHPVCTALLLYSAEAEFAGLNYLLLVLVAAALELGPLATEPQRNHISRLGSIVRHAYEDKSSSLRLILADVRSVPGMVAGVDRGLEAGGGALHREFSSLWAQWLRGLLVRWIYTNPAALSAALQPHMLTQDLDGTGVELCGEEGADADDGSSVHADLTDPEPLGTSKQVPAIRNRKARVKGLTRASGGDLYRPSDQIAPDELVSALVRAAVAAAASAISGQKRDAAEDPAALALAVATGIRELDLPFVVWGTEANGKVAALDPSRSCLYRAICRPPNAVRPATDLAGWLEPTLSDQAVWPIPPTLHKLLLALGPTGTEVTGAPVLALRAVSATNRNPLWTVAQNLVPGIAVSPSQIRLALAAQLAQEFGPEIAQLLLADTFSTSPAPAYYSALPQDALSTVVKGIQTRWFAEAGEDAPGGGGFIGSRLVLTDEAARRWPTGLRQAMRSAAHRGDQGEIARWKTQRDHLAGALCAVTGGRPHGWIGEIRLDQVVPEYGLVVLADKASDVLRQTRIAATGKRWVAGFRDYLDFLCGIAAGSLGEGCAQHAGKILRSEEPLFSMPKDHGGVFSVAELTASMPVQLQDIPNHYRHRLNQALQRAGIDPELRHAQLGWVVTPAHAMADLSPWSPKGFGTEMASVLDELMIRDGWFKPTQRVSPWNWGGVPQRSLADWDAEVASHVGAHQKEIRRQKARLVQRWKEVSDDVCARLAEAFAEYFPSLKLDTGTRRLERADWAKGSRPEDMTQDHYGLLCDRVRQGDRNPEDAAEAIAARILLFRIMLSARRRKIVSGPLPSRPVLSVTSDPSPFLLNLGLAVRHAASVRDCLLRRAAKQRAHDQGYLPTVGILAFSAYRHLEEAEAAVDAAASAVRSHRRSECVRVPSVIDRQLVPMVFGGLPAIQVARRGHDSPTAHAQDRMDLARWIRDSMQLPMPLPDDDKELLARVESLFRAAGRLELSGPERMMMLGQMVPAPDTVERCIARDDGWPLRTAVTVRSKRADEGAALYEDEPELSAGGQAKAPDADTVAHNYRRLTAALNPEQFPKLIGAKSDSHRGWRQKLDEYLGGLQGEVGGQSNLGLLVGYTRHRLRYGGRRKSHLQHASLGWLMRFASDLLAVAGQQSFLEWDEVGFRDNYLAVLMGKSVGARRQALDALVSFHSYLVEVHRVPEVPFAELFNFAGERLKTSDPGTLTDREVERMVGVLHADLADEQGKQDAAPEMVRLLELRLLMFLILEASGIRPSSAFGLTLGDLVLLGPGRDFVRVHTTGGFGRAKTAASRGFIPLEGSVWAAEREWVVSYLDQQKSTLEGVHWWGIPLFATTAGGKRRFNRAYLTHRIDALAKWVSSNRKAHTYWLRKRRVSIRHETVYADVRPMAHDVYRVMSHSGHVLFQTPAENYICDPAILVGHQLHEGTGASRANILAVTDEVGPALDMAWRRSGGVQTGHRIEVVLDRIGTSAMGAPAELVTAPPPLRRHSELLPAHIDTYARAMHRYRDRHEAMVRSQLSERQVADLDRLAMEYAIGKGVAPWPLALLRGKRVVLPTPRAFKGTKRLFNVLHSAPSADAVVLANAFAGQGHLERIHGQEVLMALPSRELVDAASRFQEATGIDVMIDSSSGVDVIAVRRDVDHGKSHAAAFFWVMAMIRIFTRFCAA